MIAKIKKFPLRNLWKNEPKNFTQDLRDNIDILNDALGFELNSPESEQSAGNFIADIVAEDAYGNTVVIENQFGKTDHDHLGKLITYVTMLDAKIGIWIAEEPKPEHIQAVSWLNESTSGDFYLIKIEAIKIDNSQLAPLFTVIVKPSLESRTAGIIKKDKAERYVLRREFWTQLLEKAKKQTKLHTNISPSTDNWISAKVKNLGFQYLIREYDGFVGLYIDFGLDSIEKNKKIFNNFLKQKDEIEKSFGGTLEWNQVEGRQYCSIGFGINVGGYKDEDKWEEIQNAMITAMIKLDKAFKPYMSKLNI
jgi:hypothetical protein